jgi:hypothetical protein
MKLTERRINKPIKGNETDSCSVDLDAAISYYEDLEGLEFRYE